MENRISIIIPYYNGENYFRELIISIFNSIVLVDVRFSFQLIVIIDSIETDFEFVNSILTNYFADLSNVDIEIVKNKTNLGVAKSRNIGLSISNGDLIHLIDQDDKIDPFFYTLILEYSNKYNFILVNGQVHYEKSKFKSHKLYYLIQKLSLENLVSNDFIRSPGQVVFSKDLILKIKFPEPVNFKGADDRFFWFKIFFLNKSLLKPFYIKRVLYHALIHSTNFSSDKLNLRKSALENWDIFLSENEPDEILLKLINNDILSLRFSANIKQKVSDQFIGLIYRGLYFLDLNRIIRFIFKQI